MADETPLFTNSIIDDKLRELISNMTPEEWAQWQLDNPRTPMIFSSSGWSDGGSTGTLEWFSSSSREGFIGCRICGHVIQLAPGEAMNFDHPDLCEHDKAKSHG